MVKIKKIKSRLVWRTSARTHISIQTTFTHAQTHTDMVSWWKSELTGPLFMSFQRWGHTIFGASDGSTISALRSVKGSECGALTSRESLPVGITLDYYVLGKSRLSLRRLGFFFYALASFAASPPPDFFFFFLRNLLKSQQRVWCEEEEEEEREEEGEAHKLHTIQQITVSKASTDKKKKHLCTIYIRHTLIVS